MTNILLVDDHKIVRDGIKYYLNDFKEQYIVKSEAENGLNALEILLEESFDLIITDVSMPILDGMGLVKEVKKSYPEIKILVISMLDNAHYVKKLIAEGIDGYLLKNAGGTELIHALEKIVNGETFFSLDVTQSVIRDMARKGFDR